MDKSYSYEGQVIRLNDEDYKRFHGRYLPDLDEPSYRAELNKCDNWLNKQNISKDWYWVFLGISSNLLLRQFIL